MKKLIITSSILVSFILAGVLYATYEHPDEVKTVTAEQVYKGQVSYEMPAVMMHPMPGFSLQ